MSNHDACPRMSIPRFADSPADVLRRAISRAADLHGVTVAEIKGRSRLGPAAAARQDVFLALREEGWSFPRIGRALFPACAGMNRSPSSGKTFLASVPRMRGDEPHHRERLSGSGHCSPHARG